MKKSIISLLFVVLFNIVNAQVPGVPKSLLSPNATSLGQYGEVPVSFYTGTPSINIPLYNLNYGEITIPISLSYQATGVQPDQHPGWVGLGWTLNSGGTISRTIKDLPDEYNNSNRGIEVNGSPYWFGERGFYYSRSQINNTWANISSNISNNLFINDTEPDEFNFSFLGISGHFYLNTDGTWQVECDKPIKVELNSTPFVGFPTNLYVDNTDLCTSKGTISTNYINNTKAFNGFKIIDDKGISYIFGNNNNAIEYSIGFFDQNTDEWFANSWMLTKIILPTGEEINFEYERDNFINQMSLNINYNIQTLTSNGVSACISSNIGLLSDYYNGFLISPVYLASISTPGSKIIFDRSKTKELRYSTNVYDEKYEKWIENSGQLLNNRYFPFINGWKPSLKELNPVTYAYDTNLPPNEIDSIEQNIQWYKLDRLRILNSNNQLVKYFQFNYSQSTNRRLTLYSLEEKTTYGTNGDVYNFNYYNMEILPPYLSSKTDHWGFFNNNLTSLPTTVDYSTYYTQREATTDATIASAGSLKEIIYPTGGKTEFIYEPHKCYKQVKIDRWNGIENISAGNKIIGGIRIKSIRDHYGENPSDYTEKNYYYVSNYSKSSNPETANSSGILGGQIKYYFESYTAKTRDNGNYSKYIFSSQTILPMSINSQGCHVGYSEVTEMSSDGSYRKLYYTDYGIKGDEQNYCNDEIFEQTNQDNSSLSPYFPYNSRKAERGKLMLIENMDPNGTIKSLKRYIYKRINPNNFVQALRLNSSEVCDVNVSNIYGNTIYSNDIIYDEAIKYKFYTYSYLPEKEIETIYGSTSSEPFTTTKTYSYNTNKLLSSESINNSNNENATTYFKYISDFQYPTESSDENLKPLIKMNSPSVHMINFPIEIINKITRNNIDYVLGSSLFLYRLTDTPTPFVKLWSENSLSITDKITDFNPISITSNSTTVNNDNRYKEKIRYNKYDGHGNPLFITKNQLENTVYLWSYNHQYPIAEISNATWTEIVGNSGVLTETQASSILNSNNLTESDWSTLKTLDNFTNGYTTLYRYIPLKGLTVKRNPNGISTYYEYDDLGHLINIYTIDANNNKRILKSLMYQTANKGN